MRNKNNKISENSTLADILKNPQAEEVLIKHKIPCLGCAFAIYELNQLTLKDVATIYNLNLKQILKDLKKIS